MFTEEFGNENLYPLVQSLSELIVKTETALFYPVFLALQRLNVLVGNDTFKLYMDHVKPDAKLLYHRVLSRHSTAASGGRSETGNMFENSSEELNNNDDNFMPAIPMEKLITCGDIPHLPKEVAESCNAVAGSFDTASSVNDSTFYGTDFMFMPEYGLFPKQVLNRAKSDKFPDKVEGLNQMLTIVREAPLGQMGIFCNHLDDFLATFLNKIFEDTNFKVNLCGLELVQSLSNRLKMSAISYMRPIVAMLIKRLGDSRAVIREHTIKVVHSLLFSFQPQPVLDALLDQKHNRNPKVREEVLNRVTAGLLTFPRSDFNLPKLCYETAPMLVDTKRMVRLAALECIAVVAQALGHQHLSPLYGAVQTVENTTDSDGLYSAVQVSLSSLLLLLLPYAITAT